MSGDLVRRLRNLVALNEPKHGGPYMGTAAVACVEAMAEAADEIERLRKLSAIPGHRYRMYSDVRLTEITDT